jgi:hypothetical protein
LCECWSIYNEGGTTGNYDIINCNGTEQNLNLTPGASRIHCLKGGTAPQINSGLLTDVDCGSNCTIAADCGYCGPTTTTTTTTTTTSTTTTTTTLAYDFYLMAEYYCVETNCFTDGLEFYVAFPTGTGINPTRYFVPVGGYQAGYAYKYVADAGYQPGAIIMSPTAYVSCPTAAGCNI